MEMIDRISIRQPSHADNNLFYQLFLHAVYCLIILSCAPLPSAIDPSRLSIRSWLMKNHRRKLKK